ncbi:heat shock 70 kDa protein 12A-like [Mytilus californianus]|uniref:heat shock 70 kDa protein 12A-like n=1 Tax=Mytilus californianus TaxID=6549 RepID=UPI0022480B31|nr:heat shock 70 kDa protein 12A-like [Mytilus californianus]XP_052060703.1 heat shock 70 kDa protein 12A-like [Mytilus californianus]
MATKGKEKFELVVALDIGTTYSGYAYSTVVDFKTNPLNVQYIQSWNAGRKRMVSHKTPTCLMLNKNEKLVAFGYEAEAAYAKLIADEGHKNSYYFHRFKMKLCKREAITKNMSMKDVTGKAARALDVFSLSIRALIDHFLKQVDVPLSKIRWVLTVPASWSDIAKQFMAGSAMMAGIPEDQLIIALESEAAAIYCEHLNSEKRKGSDHRFSIENDGSKFMMVDIGGGTTDITVLEKIADNKMKQLCSSTGGIFGGMSVDEEYIEMLENIIMGAVMRKVKSDYPQSYLEMLSSFEYLKQSIDSSLSGQIAVNIPYEVISSLCKSQAGETFESLLESSEYSGRVSLEKGKLKIDAGLLRSFFNKPILEMITLMKECFKKCEPERVRIILVVGGFSQCPFLREALKTAFPRKLIKFPHEPNLAVLKGAVLFGHEPSFIASRVVRYTYGVEVSKDYDPRLHSSDRRVIVDGEALCRGVFDTFMAAETSVPIGTAITETYTTTEKCQKSHYLPIYISSSKNPRYTDDDESSYLGTIKVPIPNPSEMYRDVKVNFYFGFTELEVEAVDVETNEKCEVKFDLL